ncbi:hypothetical protein C8P68_101933 [Mucilaginibacter yixingensis]|uniref:Uncharacterized protein n=1 Tax=Mucilaginibacter yixingensis TaxID=1295612 RepID=A0A2T5JGY7_9SPHI|nr:hypothetical protein [Mucilaginibacter yixingensis]PTR01695.1 hypothetical protein C8P68_101933 [Mucilaginibacter yixingensis]
MQTKIFLYKIEGINLTEQNELLKVSPGFDRKEVIEKLKDQFKDTNYHVDENSLIYKLIDEQLYIQGLVKEKEEPKAVGFTFGKG